MTDSLSPQFRENHGQNGEKPRVTTEDSISRGVTRPVLLACGPSHGVPGYIQSGPWYRSLWTEAVPAVCIPTRQSAVTLLTEEQSQRCRMPRRPLPFIFPCPGPGCELMETAPQPCTRVAGCRCEPMRAIDRIWQTGPSASPIAPDSAAADSAAHRTAENGWLMSFRGGVSNFAAWTSGRQGSWAGRDQLSKHGTGTPGSIRHSLKSLANIRLHVTPRVRDSPRRGPSSSPKVKDQDNFFFPDGAFRPWKRSWSRTGCQSQMVEMVPKPPPLPRVNAGEACGGHPPTSLCWLLGMCRPVEGNTHPWAVFRARNIRDLEKPDVGRPGSHNARGARDR